MGLFFIDGFDRYASYADMARRFGLAGSAVLVPGRFGSGNALSFQQNNGAKVTASFAALNNLSLGFSFEAKGTGFSGAVGGSGFANLYSGTSFIGQLVFTSAGEIAYFQSSNQRCISAPGVLADGVWAHCELTLVRHASAGSAEIRVNGELVASVTGVNTGTAAIDNVFFQSNASTTSNANYRSYDDLYISNTAVSIGEARVDLLVPNADTAQKDWTPLSGTDNYAMVGKTTFNDSTYVSASAAGAIDLYGLSDLPINPQSIKAVQVSYTAQKDDATARTIRSKLKSGATTADGATFTLGTGFQLRSDVYETDPDTSAPWTTSAVASLEAGIEVVS